jgi:hypothetical protein
MKWNRAGAALLLTLLATLALLAFTVYQTPAMRFLLDGFKLCG